MQHILKKKNFSFFSLTQTTPPHHLPCCYNCSTCYNCFSCFDALSNTCTGRIVSMISGKSGPFGPGNDLHHTDTHFWPGVRRCEHGATCRTCCWEYLPVTSRRSRHEQRDALRAPSFAGRMALYHAWELFHGEAIPRGYRPGRSCETVVCVNPQHLAWYCDQSTMTAPSSWVDDDQGSRFTCPHIAQP